LVSGVNRLGLVPKVVAQTAKDAALV